MDRRQGGKSDVELLRDARHSCHRYIGDHPAEASANGWLIHAWDVN